MDGSVLHQFRSGVQTKFCGRAFVQVSLYPFMDTLFSAETVIKLNIEGVTEMGKTNMEASEEVRNFKEELVLVLSRLDEIGNVVFEDTDCEGNLYNFKDVVYDSTTKCVKVQLSMWDDRLPDKDGKLRNRLLAAESGPMSVY